MSSPKRDSGIIADMSTEDDSKVGSFKDILTRFESIQPKSKATKLEAPNEKPYRPEILKKPLRISTLQVGLNDSYRYGKIHEVEQSALSKTDKDHDSTPLSDRNEILRQINTGPQHKQRQLGFEKSSTELSNPKIGKLQPDVLRFMDYKLQSVTNRGKYMSDEKYESSNLAAYKYNNGIDGEIPFDPVINEESEFNTKGYYEVINSYQDGFDSDDEIYSEPVLYRLSTRPLSSDSSETNSLCSPNNLQNVINELYDTEESYIQSIQAFLSIYMLGFVNHKALPFELRGKKKLIFGHFENLLQLHKDRFWPKLTECGHDTDLISKLFLEFLSQEKFYIYVVYAMNTVRIQTLCRSHREFFDEIQNESGEKLGVSSFLVQPIQRFLRYRMLLLEIINQLKKQNDQKEITDSIVICINTVCFVERFCDTLNEVQRLADIDQCSYLDEDNFEPKFMIELSDESINFYDQGKFLKMAELQISDSDLNYQYSGVFFLFEKCVIFSQKLKLDKVDKGKLDKVDKLQYRGHYDISNSEIYCGELNAFDLWDTKHSHMKFKFDSKNKSARILLQFLKKIVPESQFSRSPVLTKKGDTMWYKTKSFRKKISNAGFSLVGKLNETSHQGSSIHTGHVKEKVHYLEQLQATEENYIKNLLELKSILFDNDWYLTLFRKLSETCKTILSGILTLHQQKLQPVIKEGNEIEIFKHFEIHLKTNVFDLYQEFAVLAGQMKKMLYAETDEQSNKVLSLLLRPIYRVKEYSCIFEDIDKNFECPADANTIVELQNLHAKISRLSTKFSKKHQRVQESFQVHSFRSETVNLQSMGQVLYSDLVTIDKHPDQLRLFVLEKSILCLSIKEKEDTESYEKFIFCEPLKRKVKEDRINNKCLKVNQHKVLFSSSANRVKFTDQLNKATKVYSESTKL